ncbi:MAG: phosphodiester glycosidase family protein [Paracoccaceae bacterium]
MAMVSAVSAATCRDTEFEGTGFSVCTVSAGEDLRLFLHDDRGGIIGSFARLEETLAAEGLELVFAMNAGMYHPDRRPVGLYVEDGEREASLVTRAGPGNFGMLPNGVFCIDPEGFAVVESTEYRDTGRACRYATQSGPMLVIDGTLHPRFLPDSTSLQIRNGVGVSGDGQHAVFVISRGTVTFHRFARFFRDVLQTPDALYLDGSISRLFAPELGRADWGFPMGPIVGLVHPRG